MVTALSERNANEFDVNPEHGQLKTIADMVVKATALDIEIRQCEEELKLHKSVLKTLLEIEIPEAMQSCGVEEFTATGGLKVQLKTDDYASVPSISSIENERDPERRQELSDRRDRAIAILEVKAPSLLKRTYNVMFDRDEQDSAQQFEQELSSWDNPPEYQKGVTVHPRTLAKWVTEIKSEGQHLTDDELKALGVYTRVVAKFSR
jgi:hypothetical protein